MSFTDGIRMAQGAPQLRLRDHSVPDKSRGVPRPPKELQNSLLVVSGILCAGMGLKGFLLSSNFIDGGITGVSMLLNKTTGISLSVCLLVVNLPFIVLAYKSLGARFAAR